MKNGTIYVCEYRHVEMYLFYFLNLPINSQFIFHIFMYAGLLILFAFFNIFDLIP